MQSLSAFLMLFGDKKTKKQFKSSLYTCTFIPWSLYSLICLASSSSRKKYKLRPILMCLEREILEVILPGIQLNCLGK